MFSALFDWLLGAGREAAVFIISMVPLVELRGAVPLGAAAGIPWTTLFPLAILGNMLPIPLLLVFGEKLLAWAETLPPLRKFAAAYKKKLLSKSKPCICSSICFFGTEKYFRSIKYNLYIFIVAVYAVCYPVKIAEYFIIAVVSHCIKVIYSQINYNSIKVFDFLIFNIICKIKFSVIQKRICHTVFCCVCAVV